MIKPYDLAAEQRILSEHFRKYPLMQPEDCVKLLYQGAFGAEHLISNPEQTFDRLCSEYKALQEENDSPQDRFTEEIGNRMCRVFLSGIPEHFLSDFHRLFVLGSGICKGSEDRFRAVLQRLPDWCRDGTIGLSPEKMTDYLETYTAHGLQPVSHSAVYRTAYKPAYRVLPALCAELIAPLLAIRKKSAEQRCTVVAVDGMCGSGKSTAAHILSEILSAPVIHMDDFFVPAECKDAAHRQLPVHFERFEAEVLRPLRTESGFSYRIYDCEAETMAGERHIPPSEIRIVEGSYSQAIQFGKYYDISLFLRCSDTVQMERLSKRCGNPALLELFRTEWIPAEHRFFDAEQTQERVDYRIES